MKMKNTKKRNILIVVIMVLTVVSLIVTDHIIDSKKPEYPIADTIIKPFAKEHGLKLSAWPDEIKAMLEKNPETEEFVLNYPLLKDKDEDYSTDEYGNSKSVPYLLQWDTRWGYKEYAGSIIAISGCGPVSLSMVAMYLLDNTSLNPQFIADFAEKEGYAVKNNGSSWTLMSEGAEKLGLISKELPLDEQTMINYLKNGNPIICIMGEGDFTSSGHFIVLTDFSEEEGFSVLDPNSKERTAKKWTYERISSQIRNIWAFSADKE